MKRTVFKISSKIITVRVPGGLGLIPWYWGQLLGRKIICTYYVTTGMSPAEKLPLIIRNCIGKPLIS